jgi:hypothetical protein
MNAGQLADASILFYTTGQYPAAFTGTGVVFPGHGMNFVNARPARPVGSEPMPGASNFFLGNDPARWRTGVSTFGGLLYPGLYDGIDLRFRLQEGNLKYEYIVAAGADPSAIALAFDGAVPSVSDDTLVLETGAGNVRDGPLFIYQDAGMGRSVVDARLIVSGADVRYDIGPYDRSLPLVIDPVISATVLGGSGDDYAVSTAVDSQDNGYIAGETLSADFPTTQSAFSNHSTGTGPAFDIFITKLAPDGKRALFSTYVGSSGNDFVHDLEVDTAGFVYITGYTYEFDFPTTEGAFDRGYNSYGDAFALKLSPAGTKLTFSTFLGGDDVDFGYALALGADGSVYVAGGTVSIDLPTTDGALQRSIKAGTDSQDAFVARLAPDGSALRWCTYLGGSGMDYVLAIDVDDCGVSHLTGATSSPDFPTTDGALSRANKDQDAFVALLDASGGALAYSTFLGGLGTDVGKFLALDGSGGFLVLGDTTSWDLPRTGQPAAEFYHGYWDCFVAWFEGNGSSLRFCGYMGGSGDDQAASVLLDAGGNLTLAGTTSSPDLETTAAAENGWRQGGRDIFVVRLDAGAQNVTYRSYFGGSRDDDCAGAALDRRGLVVLAGTTSSTDLPGAPRNGSNGKEAFLARLAPVCVPGAPALTHATGNHTVDLVWTAPALGAGTLEGYVLYRGRNDSGMAVCCRLPAGVLDYRDAGLENGVHYHYTITAVNASGEGERSAVRVAMPGLAPSAPQNLTAAGRPSRVELSWQPPEHAYDMPILKYRLYRWVTGNPPALVAELANATSFNDGWVYNDFVYNYEIKAVNVIGEGAPSGTASAIPSNRPSAPQNLSAYLDGRAVTLSWDLPDNTGTGAMEGYNVYYILEDGRRRLAGRTPVMLYVDKDLLAGRYTYIVLANSTTGEGYPTDPATVSITNTPPVAGFDPDRLEGTTGQPFFFTSTSYDRDTFIVNYTWSFGDGSRSFKQDPVHYYPRRGFYNVTLKVRDVDGAEASASGTVSVLNTPPSIGLYSPAASTVAYRGRSREFSITPQDPDQDTLETVWSINGSVAGTGHRVRITFNLTGTYILTATLGDGEASTLMRWNVTVEPAPPGAPSRPAWHYLLGAGTAALAAAAGIVIFRRRARKASPSPPAPGVRKARKNTARRARGPAPKPDRTGKPPVNSPPQKDIIRKRYS